MDVMEHLHSRGYDTAQYRTWLTETVATFPLYDFAGLLAGYQQYTPFAPKHMANPKEARYFTRARRQLLWGTYLPLRSGPIWLTESVFKSAAIHKAGGNSWSLLGSDISHPLMQQLLLLPYTFICIGDDDIAGAKLSRQFPHGFTAPELDELSTDEVRSLIAGFI